MSRVKRMRRTGGSGRVAVQVARASDRHCGRGGQAELHVAHGGYGTLVHEGEDGFGQRTLGLLLLNHQGAFRTVLLRSESMVHIYIIYTYTYPIISNEEDEKMRSYNSVSYSSVTGARRS